MLWLSHNYTNKVRAICAYHTKWACLCNENHDMPIVKLDVLTNSFFTYSDVWNTAITYESNAKNFRLLILFLFIFFRYVWFCAHFCLWWLKYIYIFFSSIRWLFMFIRVVPICNWELYVFKNLFSVILNSRRPSPGLMCYLQFSHFFNPFQVLNWYVHLRYHLGRATRIVLARRQTRKKIYENDLVLYSFL